MSQVLCGISTQVTMFILNNIPWGKHHWSHFMEEDIQLQKSLVIAYVYTPSNQRGGIKLGLSDSRWNALPNASAFSSCTFQRLFGNHAIQPTLSLLMLHFPSPGRYSTVSITIPGTWGLGTLEALLCFNNMRIIYSVTPFQIRVKPDAVRVTTLQCAFQLNFRTLCYESSPRETIFSWLLVVRNVIKRRKKPIGSLTYLFQEGMEPLGKHIWHNLDYSQSHLPLSHFLDEKSEI